jgi:hypothetical protein
MNSRFDEAVEQILNDIIVSEAAAGMSSLPGAAEPDANKKSFLGNLTKATLKGAGSALASGAKKAATLGAQAGAVGLGLTPNVGAKTAGAVGGAMVTAGSTIKQAWQDKGATQPATQPGTASQPAQTNTSTTSPTKTVANIIPTIQPQKINSTISNFPKLNADKNHLQTAVPNLLRGLRGNYSAQDLVQMVTGSIPPGSQVKQIASNNAMMNKINTDLQNYLVLNDKDRAQLKAQIPALLRGIKSTATIEDVGQLLTNVLA